MITKKHIDANGTVHLWDLGPTKVRMPAIDARHAIETEPGRWALVDPESPDQYRGASEFGGESAGQQRVDLSRRVALVEVDPHDNDLSKWGGESADQQHVDLSNSAAAVEKTEIERDPSESGGEGAL